MTAESSKGLWERGMSRRGAVLACGVAAMLPLGAALAGEAAPDGTGAAAAGDAGADGADVAGGQDEDVSGVATTDDAGVISVGGFTLLPYPHYASGGVKQDLYAAILFENSNATFTRYQVAYTSCTCRDAASNYRSVVYVEILNTAASADEAKLRWVCFTDNDGYDVGFWGDSNPIHGQPTYTADYMETTFVEPLVGLTKADFDAWGGYGTQVEGIDVDAVSGASVSTANITSVLRALFAYHAGKYYGA